MDDDTFERGFFFVLPESTLVGGLEDIVPFSVIS